MEKMFNFSFRSMEDRTDLNKLIDFIAKQDLDYPKYDYWVQKTEQQLDTGFKKSVLAYSDNVLVGDLIYQSHDLPNVIELKNLRTSPQIRHRGFAYFMLKQLEAECKEFDTIICDVRANKSDIIQFMMFAGYKPMCNKPLYEKYIVDTIMVKNIKKREK